MVGLFILIMLLPTPDFLKPKDKDDNSKDKNESKDKDQDRDQDGDEDDASSWEAWGDDYSDLYDEDGDQVGGFFLPLPLTLKKIPGKIYSRNDPEWKEFIKISEDGRELAIRGRSPQPRS